MKTHTLRLNYGKKNVQLDQIKYIQSVDGNYSRIVVKEGKDYLAAFTLKHFRVQLTETPNFKLGRKGLLLNLDYIKKLEEKDRSKIAILKTGERFLLSRRVGRALAGYLKEKSLGA